MQNLLSLKDVSKILNLKESTIYAWVHRKKISYVKIGGKLAFIEAHIQDFIEKNTYN
ncbi:MAG: hypothetical protein UR30_C0005G0024 [Candidatus Peregrinibacteria bacterium GW2011_GWC2_33_13]|nr:MAG: hypothetical protein UR30_C0005G0024 [Candidatus Peregrinibacteria bacterium GW2011_GWC2_33_13]